MTKEEKHLWYDFLSTYPVRFRRQQIIGRYIVDFYCASAKLVIELDGSQHYDPAGHSADAQRDAYLRSLGMTVVRYSNLEIQQNFEGVCTDILQHLPKPSPSGGRWHRRKAMTDEGTADLEALPRYLFPSSVSPPD